MPDNRENMASVRYWQTPPERVPQRFYVAFCLLMSSIQDWILGQKERASNNLNWSATCSYYSLVHGGRLLCFLALGDYPTQHSRLRDIFSAHQQQQRNRPSGRDGYPFDWLRGFASLAVGQAHQRCADDADRTPDFRRMIVSYLNQVNVAGAEESLTKFGAVLAAAAPLRNDSNYEALLIAHEYHHVAMSDAFNKLSLHMATAAESTLPFLIDAFNSFRLRDPDLPSTREEYEAFLHVYVNDRIGEAIRRKLGGSIPLETKLEDVLRLVGTRPTGAQYHQLEDQVSMALFGGKARLMVDFERRIDDLSRVTGA